ncbi:MAG: hypothetical protein J3Q66DRAFT_325676 [Benniella sp.]|nr:MAG: hypothetical protein J3Q66DRAFT_325676 [Benniella sp.]
MSEKPPKDSEKSQDTFKEHAEAIARFTLSHVNRPLPSKSFYPSLPTKYAPHIPKETPRRMQEPNRTTVARTTPLQPRSVRISPAMTHRIPSRSTSIPKLGLGVLGKRSSLSGSPTVMNQGNRVLRTNSNIEPKLQKILPNFARGILPDRAVETLKVLWPSKAEITRSQEEISVFTLLLDQGDLKGANHTFFEGLLKKADHEWIPHASMALNPIKRVMDISNERLLKALIDYCIRNAQQYHPVFLTPVIQCLSAITEWYPEILCDLFLRASYIPAHNPEYVASHAIIANLRSSDFFTFFTRLFGIFKGGSTGFSKPSNINQYKAPVFSVRSHLPFYSHTGVRSYFGWRATHFPQKEIKEIKERDAPTVVKRSRKIYVSPFQFKPINGQRNRSFLSQTAGRDIFNSPAIVASLCYKWNKIGLYFWYMRFVVVLTFFMLVMTITAKQIQISTLTDGGAPTADEIAARYLPKWRPVFMVTIAIGLLLILFELLQVAYSPRKYFRSPYNYVDLAAFVIPLTGCFVFLFAKPEPQISGEQEIKKEGPEQFWFMGLGIFFLYLNMLFELRIIKPLGIAVNIIFNIARRIKWFFLILGVFLVSFTHSLLYVLHTRRYRKCTEGETCEDNYPTDFFDAFATTYFFMSGQFEPIKNGLEKGPAKFRILVMVFVFCTSIILLNVLIALMNDAFNASEREGKTAYWKLVSEVLAELEMLTVYNEGASSNDGYSEYIYYCATDEEVKEFRSKFSDSEMTAHAESSKAAHEVTHKTQNKIIEDVKAVGDAVRDNSQVIENLKVDTPDAYSELKEELAAMRELIENSRSGKVEQELAQLKELVNSLVLHLQANNLASQP